MQLLLKENIEKLGRRGDVVDVATGYARNYLLPQGKALPVLPKNMKQIERAKARIIAEEAEKRARLEEFRQILSTLSCTLHMNATDEGHLYGSVGPKEVVAAVAEAGHTIGIGEVILDEHIKEVGLWSVPVVLDQEITAQVRIWVVPEVVETKESSGETESSQDA